jgi:hypothetical protein
LFAWGVSVGVVGVAGSHLIGRVAGLGYHRRRGYASFLVMSVLVAAIAAALPSLAVDLVYTVFVAIANFAIPLLLLPRLRRLASQACGSDVSGASCGATACATCPLGAGPK